MFGRYVVDKRLVSDRFLFGIRFGVRFSMQFGGWVGVGFGVRFDIEPASG